MKQVLIDTDPGIDDALALFFALGRPEINILGLTCVFGNVSVDTATRNALWLMNAAGRPDIPVARGAAKPLDIPPRPHPAKIHGVHGFGALPERPSVGSPQDADAADFIIETSKLHPGEVHLVTLGPLTNIAIAVQRDPDLPSRLASLHIMGGAFHVPGNASPHAEANIRNDPHAAAFVATKFPMARFIGLDVTDAIVLTEEDCQSLARRGGQWGAFLDEITTHYLNFYIGKGRSDGAGLHDPTTLIALLMPELFTFQSGNVRVTTEGDGIGKTAIANSDASVCAAVSAKTREVHRVFMSSVEGWQNGPV